MKTSDTIQRTNRLAKESSPYLLQHQHNPVDWYPWGPEAIETARRQDKPIFLSVGYSTCYWCHVMERQCFEHESIAELMNDLFINIKVDREERPDVDNLYMTAVQVLTQHGGWPMSVFLTPDLRPFYGGTYFPPQDGYGRPGFPTVLRSIEDAYRNRKVDVEKSANQLITILRELAQPPAPAQPIRIDEKFIDQQIRSSVYDYDAMLGGFGSAPKFPRQTLLELMLVSVRPASLKRHSPEESNKHLAMVRNTLNAMANGGIRDHLGGAFHRYSTDAKWLVPHFEIMLYDNAMLAWCYVEAHRQTGEARYADITRRLLDFILREMTSPDGAFYTAFDAEVDAQEGLNYLWTRQEIETVLGVEDSRAFCKLYGVDAGPNFVDPHHGGTMGGAVPDKNILFLKNADGENEPLIISAREKLYEARAKRKQPLLDTKILTSWNALMIRAFAYAGQVLKEQRYVDAAIRAAQFILNTHRIASAGHVHMPAQVPSDQRETLRPPLPPGEGWGEGARGLENAAIPEPLERDMHKPSPAEARPLTPAFSRRERGPDVPDNAPVLARTSRDGVAKYLGFLDDYAFLAQALLAIADATGDQSWRARAEEIAGHMKARFSDREAGGFYFTDKSAVDLPVRQKIASDSPLPSGNAVAAEVLVQLGDHDGARAILSAFAENLKSQGAGMSSMLESALRYLETQPPFTVSAAAQTQSDVPRQLAANVVGIESRWRDEQTLEIDVHILEGFHLHANPASGDFPATELFLHDEMHATIDYPPGVDRLFAFATEPIRVYEGQVQLIARFAQPLTGKGVVPMVLRYQACDESSCLAPMSKKFEVNAP